VSILQRDVRASDHDREAAVAFLKAHYADGRLGDHELGLRTEAAYRAVGVRELEWLISDLPSAPPPPRRPRSPVLPVVLLVAAIALWLVTVPPEITLVLIALTFVAVLLLSPLWIPALLAFMAYRAYKSLATEHVLVRALGATRGRAPARARRATGA
jgi:Domain of unknown function (DUF1707)